MRITKALLKEWSACTSGYGWFIQLFPQGASCHEVARALREDKRYDDERWLFSNVFNKFVAQPEIIADVVKKDTETQICAGTALIAKLAESADKSDGSQLAASGNDSQLAASGTRSVAVAAGFGSSASAGENGAFALPWLDGEQVRIAVGIVGENGIKAGLLYRVDGAGTLIEAGA